MVAQMKRNDYRTFLDNKRVVARPVGVKTDETALPDYLFDFQRKVVAWALRRGRAALFQDCGLGKSVQSLVWAENVIKKSKKPVLILAPLGVTYQTVEEGEKFGIKVEHVNTMPSKIQPAIYITNYEKLHHFEAEPFSGIVIDECFPPDTLVDTPSGRVYIKDIRRGDLINNALGVDKVNDIHRRRVPYAVKISIGERSIISSPNHPYFTQRGWVCAQDVKPGDSFIETTKAVRMVQGLVSQEIGAAAERGKVLRSILFSEMADEPAGVSSESAYSRSGCQARGREAGMVCSGESGRRERTGTDSQPQPNEQSNIKGEMLPHVEEDEAQTFRAWGQWTWFNSASKDTSGCVRTELDSGISFVVGKTDSRLSNELQARLSIDRAQNRYRSGWALSSQPEGNRSEEGCETGDVRVEGLEILEPGHPELEQYRDDDGSLYFYDIGATWHPSFSVNGFLVHNSSILKSVDGKTRTKIIDSFKQTPYRLACTATPAPNDHMELGNHAEFLGIMTRSEMLAMFFTHDGGDTSKWRLKGHAVERFWKWVASWAVMVRFPSDIGCEDGRFILPELHFQNHVVASDMSSLGQLFDTGLQSLTERRAARKASLTDRVQLCADLVKATDEQFLIWCDLNAEQDTLASMLNGRCVSIQGSTDEDDRLDRLRRWKRGEVQTLVSKPSVFGFGLNMQNCHNVAFVGLSDSYEAFYQATRRVWRFGQEREVNCHIITSEAEGAVLQNIQRKEKEAKVMQDGMLEHMKDIGELTQKADRERSKYVTSKQSGDGWQIDLGDCVELLRQMPEGEIDYSIYSPPFNSLYTYSNSERDMGNCRDYADFAEHFKFFAAEMFRVIRPGRLMSFHCMNLPTSKVRDGHIGIQDFRGDLIRIFLDAGFIFHSEVVIWKDPVTAMQRTKALGLLYKQLCKDSAMSRQGIPDYLVTMRRPGINDKPVTNGTKVKFDDYIGDSGPEDTTPGYRHSIEVWQRYASPVWLDINPSDTLQYTTAREAADERHICPLQLQVIERGIELWTNPDDVVLDPFTGIGSTGYVAVKRGRRFRGTELKRSYWEMACRNLRDAEQQNRRAQMPLFAEVAIASSE